MSMQMQRVLLVVLSSLMLPANALLSSDANISQDSSSVKRSYVPVQSTVAQVASGSTTALTASFLGNTTTTLCQNGVYTLPKSVSYATTSLSGCPMISITSDGVTLDMSHNMAYFARSGTCSAATPGSHAVGISVGYSPNALGSSTQPTSIVIENGTLSGWDIGILVHHGVRNVVIRNMVFTGNVIPIVVLSQDTGTAGTFTKDLVTISFENVTIIGSNSAQLTCLKWVRSYLTDGTAQDSGPAASSTVTSACGYTATAVMQKADNPVDDALAGVTGAAGGAYVYTGIYCYGAANVSLKNVSVSDVGYNGGAENSATYGLWFRYCQATFLEDVESTRCKSTQTTVGMYADSCDVLTVQNAQFSNNGVTFVSVGAGARVPEMLWAAAIVIKDCNVVSIADALMSKTFGYNNAWGLRTIFSPAGSIQTRKISCSDCFADFIRGDRVYGFDFGDLYRKDASTPTPVRLFAGKVRSLDMKNISVTGAQGRLATATVALEFKGIYLGDASSNIEIDNIIIADNDIASGATGQNSGIEFGASSVVTGASSTLIGLKINDATIINNGAAIATGATAFCPTRAVVGGGTNIFQNIKVTNSLFQNNSGDGVRVANAAGTVSGTIRSINLDANIFDSNALGLALPAVTAATITNSSFQNNTAGGIAFTGAATDLTIDSCQVDNNAVGAGVSITGAVISLNLSNSSFCRNATSGFTVSSTLTDMQINNCQFDNNVTRGFSVTGAAVAINLNQASFSKNTTNGVVFASTLNDCLIDGCQINSNAATGFEVTGVSNILTLKKSSFSGNTGLSSSGITLTGATDTVAITDCLFQKNGNNGFAGVSTSFNISFDNCKINYNTASGISLGAAQVLSVKNTKISNNNIAISLSTILELEVENCYIGESVNNGINISATAAGVVIKDTIFSLCQASGMFINSAANDFFIENCQFNNNTLNGINFNSAATCIKIKQSKFQKNIASGLLATTSMKDLKIEDSLFDSNNNGLYITTTADAVSFKNSSFNNNVLNGIAFIGALTSGNFSNIEVNNTSSSAASTPVYGIFATTAKNVVFENVQIFGTTATGTGTASTATGIHFASSGSTVSCQNIKMTDCIITGTTSTNGNVAVTNLGATGINMTGGGVGIIMKNVNVSGCLAATGDATSWNMTTLTTRGFESVYVDGFNFSDNRGITAAYGIKTRVTVVTTAILYGLAHMYFSNGFANNNIVASTGIGFGISLVASSAGTLANPLNVKFINVKTANF